MMEQAEDETSAHSNGAWRRKAVAKQMAFSVICLACSAASTTACALGHRSGALAAGGVLADSALPSFITSWLDQSKAGSLRTRFLESKEAPALHPLHLPA